MFCDEFPAAATKSWFAAPAALIASSSACEKPPPPHELLVSFTPAVIAYWMPEIAPAVEPEPGDDSAADPADLPTATSAPERVTAYDTTFGLQQAPAPSWLPQRVGAQEIGRAHV